MIKSAWYFIISALFIFLLIGCARWGGDNPLGITGGSDQGYGQNNDLNLSDTSAVKTIDPLLLDTWYRYNYYMIGAITFNANGTFNAAGDIIISHNQYINGTYFTSGYTITFNLNRVSHTGTYFINEIEHQLTINIDGESMSLYSDEIIIN